MTGLLFERKRSFERNERDGSSVEFQVLEMNKRGLSKMDE